MDSDDEDENELEAYEAEQKRYLFCRKIIFFNEIESLVCRVKDSMVLSANFLKMCKKGSASSQTLILILSG